MIGKPLVTNVFAKTLGATFLWFILSQPVFARLPVVPFPDDVRVDVVGEDLVVNGLPLMAYEFHTNETVNQIADFYVEEWKKTINNADVDQAYLKTHLGEWTILSRLENGYNITVQLMQDGIRGTRALVGVSPIPDYLKKHKKNRPVYSVPQLGLANIISLVVSHDNGVRSETYWIDSADSVQGVIEKYKHYYESKGYKVRANSLSTSGSKQGVAATMQAVSKNERIRMDSTEVDGKTRVVAVRSIN